MPAQPDRNATIAASATASAAVGTAQGKLGSFQLPTMSGTAITVQVNDDGSANWTNCPVEGNEVNPLVTASNGTYALPVKTFCFRYFRLVSGSTETAARTIPIFIRD